MGKEEQINKKIDKAYISSLAFNADECEICLSDEVKKEYELKFENGKFLFVKKRKYPKTYEDCCKALLLNQERATCGIGGLEYKRHLIVCFQRLLICRDAYWKLAGEQMGLSKPWEYDILKDEFSSAISYKYGYIQKCEIMHQNKILIFPTEEMLDAFYENFKDLIEECKELL